MKVAKKFNMLKSLNGNNNKGFSLVELIIIIAIMAILVAILSPMYFQYVEDTQDDILRSAAEQVHSVVQTEVALENLGVYKGASTQPTATIQLTTDSNGEIVISYPKQQWEVNHSAGPSYLTFMGEEDMATSEAMFSDFVGDVGESDSDLVVTFDISIPININGVTNDDRVVVVSEMRETRP